MMNYLKDERKRILLRNQGVFNVFFGFDSVEGQVALIRGLTPRSGYVGSNFLQGI